MASFTNQEESADAQNRAAMNSQIFESGAADSMVPSVANPSELV